MPKLHDLAQQWATDLGNELGWAVNPPSIDQLLDIFVQLKWKIEDGPSAIPWSPLAASLVVGTRDQWNRDIDLEKFMDDLQALPRPTRMSASGYRAWQIFQWYFESPQA